MRYRYRFIWGGRYVIGGYFFDFVSAFLTLLHLPPLRFHTVSEDAGIEPRTVATLALAVRRANNSARSHPHGWM